MVIAPSAMEPVASPQKKLRSPSMDAATSVNPKTSITCTNVPDGLFDPNAAKRHFSKFGKVQKIKLFLKRKICIIEYEQPAAVERALLNAGAFDGFMFDVSRYKAKVRRRSKRDDDPDWLPDPDVEKELSAMRGAPMYRTPRQKAMDVSPATSAPKPQVTRVFQQSPVRKKTNPVREKILGQPASGIDTPVAVTATQTSMSTSEAAAELNQLRNKTSHSADEQWRILDARDRILRAWGGAGSRVKVGGATIGTCPDMCPEKERLHRMAEHQVMSLETVPDSDGKLDPMRAVKQYSRSSADQEIPMCYELRPPAVLMSTCRYLLHQVADTKRPVSMADWFHFMWDRFRGIRKDITQQALCCAESIKLVEMCARFHAHCAARLADLEHTQFDQKLNTDNLTKCLQTLKHMYTDVQPEVKPREAEFRGYVALLNLGDANFWWEIKQLPESIQKSDAIIFAIQVFNALDNNNYVRFFRLVKEKATYLQACILLRYFNDVRARALARMVKAYAPRGGSRFPAQDIINALAFESIDAMKSFINHYGLRFAKMDDIDLAVILDRNQFIEDSDPYPLSRSKELIESKRKCLVGEVIAGGPLLPSDLNHSSPYSSFNKDGTLKDAALISEDQGYNTLNDSNKNIQALKIEITNLAKGGKSNEKSIFFVNSDIKAVNSLKAANTFYTPDNETADMKIFSFKPAIAVAPIEVLNNSPEKINEFENNFSFSKPQETLGSSIFIGADRGNLFKAHTGTSESIQIKNSRNEFTKPSLNLFSNSNKSNNQLHNKPNTFKENKKTENDLQKCAENVFSQASHEALTSKSVFGGFSNKNFIMNKGMGDIVNNNNNIFSKVKNDEIEEADGKIPKNSVFKEAIEKESTSKFSTNIFANVNKPEDTKISKVEDTNTGNIFGSFKTESKPGNIFSRLGDKPKSPFAVNGETNQTSPGNLFKSAIAVNSDPKYSIFQSKNKTPTVADNIFNSVKVPSHDQVYEFAQNDEEERIKSEQLRLQEERRKEEEKRRQEEIRKQEIIRQEEQRRQEMIRLEEEKRKEEQRQQEIKRQEEKRQAEEKKKQEELRKKIEEEKLKKQIEEEKKRFQKRVDTESDQLINELIDEIKDETVLDLIKDEVEKLNCLMSYAKSLSEDICVELCNEICHSEMKAEKFLTEKLIKKWFFVWRRQFMRNIKRRRLLEDTPVWLPDNTPVEEAMHLRRLVEKATLKNMNAIHRGYKFSGDLNLVEHPEPLNIMEIIKSSLLKRMKQINYPYDKCFFWKVTLVSPGPDYWLYRKIDLENWLLKAFGDQKTHDASESLINVGKHSWNNLMDFAISVGMTNLNNLRNSSDIIENTHGLIFYATENDEQFMETIKNSLNLKYPYQIIPVAIIMSNNSFKIMSNMLNEILTEYVKCNSIMAFRIFVIDSNNIPSSLTTCTKSALKWVAKKYPETPPLEIDYLKSICERYLGNEIWHRFRTERDSRMKEVLKDAYKLVNCFNASIDKLIEVVTNEDLFNYPDFPLEFKTYLDDTSPYPKPYEFIPSAVKTSENANGIKDILNKLKLPLPEVSFKPVSVDNMQDQIRSYCNQIGWFEDPEEVVCKVVAVLPQQLSDLTIPSHQFRKHFEKYDLIDFFNVIVYEKINMLKSIDKRFAIYERNVLEEYRSANWLYEVNVIMGMKHKALDYDDDDIELLNEAKRRKLTVESMDYPMLEDKDCSIVFECINATDLNISKYTNCSEAVKQLESKLEEEKQKSIDLENLLRAALSDA